MGLTGDRALADDLTADAFVRLWTATGEIRLPTVRAYLCTIVRHLYRVALEEDTARDHPSTTRWPIRSTGLPRRSQRRSEAAAALRAMATLSAERP